MWVPIFLSVLSVWCSGFPLELPPDSAAESFGDCHVRAPEGHVLLVTSGDIRQGLLTSVLSDLLRPNRNTVTHCNITNCPQMTFVGQNKGISFQWVVILYPSLLGMDKELLLNFLIGSPNWGPNSKIVFIFEDPLSSSYTLVMDLLHSFITSGIFNIGILQPGSPCQLITLEPFSNQLRVNEDPAVFDPKHGKWHYDLNGHHMTVYHDVDALPFNAKKKIGGYVYRSGLERLVYFWNATGIYEEVKYMNKSFFVTNWTRPDVVSKFRFVSNGLPQLIDNNYITDMTPLVYQPTMNFELLLTSNGMPDDLYYIYKLFLNRHSLALFLVFVLGNALYLTYSRCRRAQIRNRTSILKHFLDTLPLCSLQSMNFKADTVVKRTFCVGFVTTLFFLGNAFNCHVTSKMIELNIRMQIKTVQDVVDRGIPIVVENSKMNTLCELLKNEVRNPQEAKLFNETDIFKNTPKHSVCFFLMKYPNSPEYPVTGVKRIKFLKNIRALTSLFYIMPQHSPYLEDFEFFWRASFEGSITSLMWSHYYKQRDFMVLNERFYDENHGSLQLEQMVIFMKIHLILLTGAFLVFLGEFFNERICFSWRFVAKKVRKLTKAKAQKLFAKILKK